MAIAASAALVSYGAYKLVKRLDLKEGDEEIAKERNRVLRSESSSSVPTVVTHCLHPQHPLNAELAGKGSVCNACHKSIQANTRQYCCTSGCSFKLHQACAITNNWTKTKNNFHTFAHEHPLKLVHGTSEFHCSYCKNDYNGESLRYQCQDKDCLDRMHLICATNPTMIRTFLHPNHILELKTRHHFKKCGVCHHGGKTNARVYTCEACDFFVHPECAQCFQYWDHPLHDHTLVLRELPEKQKCGVCRHKCKRWSYTCNSCQGVHFHRNCLIQNQNLKKHSASKMRQYGKIIKEIGEVAIDSFIDESFGNNVEETDEDANDSFIDDSVIPLLQAVITAFIGGSDE